MKKATTSKRAATKTSARKPVKRAAPRSKPVKAIPDGYHAVNAYLCVDGAANAIDFYKRSFGARERLRLEAPGGKVGHAEIVIGDSAVMLADEFPEMNFRGPKPGGASSVNMYLYVKDVDAVFTRAIKEGARIVRAIEDKFYGDRTGSLEDPFGHVWHLATHKEDLSPAEMQRRRPQEAKKAGQVSG